MAATICHMLCRGFNALPYVQSA